MAIRSGQSLAGQAITGGTINNTVIGGTTPAAGTFTTLGATTETLTNTSAGVTTTPLVLVNSSSVASSALSIQMQPSTSPSRVAKIVTTNDGSNGISMDFLLNVGATVGDVLRLKPNGLDGVQIESSTGQVNFYASSSGTYVRVLDLLYVASAVNRVSFTPAAANGSPGFTSAGSDTNPSLALAAQGAGAIRIRNLLVVAQAAPTAKTTSTTLTAAELLTGEITVNQGAGAVSTLTMPTGTDMQTGLPADFATNDSFVFSIINISTNILETATLADGSAGFTGIGGKSVLANSAAGAASSATFRVRKTAANTFTYTRIG